MTKKVSKVTAYPTCQSLHMEFCDPRSDKQWQSEGGMDMGTGEVLPWVSSMDMGMLVGRCTLQQNISL